jgi:hypothetical protein
MGYMRRPVRKKIRAMNSQPISPILERDVEFGEMSATINWGSEFGDEPRLYENSSDGESLPLMIEPDPPSPSMVHKPFVDTQPPPVYITATMVVKESEDEEGNQVRSFLSLVSSYKSLTSKKEYCKLITLYAGSARNINAVALLDTGDRAGNTIARRVVERLEEMSSIISESSLTIHGAGEVEVPYLGLIDLDFTYRRGLEVYHTTFIVLEECEFDVTLGTT